MPITNAYRNQSHATLTSIDAIAVTDQSGNIAIGSDNDTQATVNVRGLNKCQVRIAFRDQKQAYACSQLTANTDFVYTNHALVGTNAVVTIGKVTFGQPEDGGQSWDNVKLFNVTGNGGAVVVV